MLWKWWVAMWTCHNCTLAAVVHSNHCSSIRHSFQKLAIVKSFLLIKCPLLVKCIHAYILYIHRPVHSAACTVNIVHMYSTSRLIWWHNAICAHIQISQGCISMYSQLVCVRSLSTYMSADHVWPLCSCYLDCLEDVHSSFNFDSLNFRHASDEHTTARHAITAAENTQETLAQY